MRRFIVSLALLTLVLTAACGQSVAQSSAIALAESTALPTKVDAVTDTTSFAEALRVAGALVTPDGDVSPAFLRVDGTVLRVDDQRVQVYEYATDADAREDAARFSPDGAWVSSDIGSTLVNWLATPHLYRAARLIAVYVGDDQPTQRLLEGVLGVPFAGGANPYRTAAIPID